MFARQSLRASSVLGAAVVGGGATFAGYSLHNSKNTPSVIRTAYADAPPGPTKVFSTSGFVNLQLHSSEMVNHNVKKLKFKLTAEDAVTGIEPICKWKCLSRFQRPYSCEVASLLTRHTPQGAWIPVFRPYTPIIVGKFSRKPSMQIPLLTWCR